MIPNVIAPLYVSCFDFIATWGDRLAGTGLAIIMVLISSPTRYDIAAFSGGGFNPPDPTGVDAVEGTVETPLCNPVCAVQNRFGSQNPEHAPHGVGSVEGGRGTPDDLGAIGCIGVHQAKVLVRRIAEKGVVQAHAIDQVQNLRTLQATNDWNALAWGGLLEKGTGKAAQHFRQ